MKAEENPFAITPNEKLQVQETLRQMEDFREQLRRMSFQLETPTEMAANMIDRQWGSTINAVEQQDLADTLRSLPGHLRMVTHRMEEELAILREWWGFGEKVSVKPNGKRAKAKAR